MGNFIEPLTFLEELKFIADNSRDLDKLAELTGDNALEEREQAEKITFINTHLV